MAKGTKELKRRITGVRNIRQITAAMESGELFGKVVFTR